MSNHQVNNAGMYNNAASARNAASTPNHPYHQYQPPGWYYFSAPYPDQRGGGPGPSTYNPHDVAPVVPPSAAAVTTGKRRSRTVFDYKASSYLDAEFSRNAYPDYESRCYYARLLHVTEDRIQVWFQNKRSRSRGKKLNRGPSSSPLDLQRASLSTPESSNSPSPHPSTSPKSNHSNTSVTNAASHHHHSIPSTSTGSHYPSGNYSSPMTPYYPTVGPQLSMSTYSALSHSSRQQPPISAGCTQPQRADNYMNARSTLLNNSHQTATASMAQVRQRRPQLSHLANSECSESTDEVFTNTQDCRSTLNIPLLSNSTSSKSVTKRPNSLRLDSLELPLSTPTSITSFSPLWNLSFNQLQQPTPRQDTDL